MNSVLNWLDNTSLDKPGKIAIKDENGSITYIQVLNFHRIKSVNLDILKLMTLPVRRVVLIFHPSPYREAKHSRKTCVCQKPQ